MRILITGGAGFMGSNFVRFLLDRRPSHQVCVLDALTYAGNLENLGEAYRDEPRLRFVHGNIRNSALVEELVADCDAVVHMAAETHVPRSIHDNVVFVETDVFGTQVLLNAVLKRPVERFVHILTESHPLNPTTPYAAAKTGADRLVYAYHQTYGLPCVILRPFNTFGPHQHLEKVVPRFITSALLDSPLTIHGDGSSSRDWLFVDDFCAAVDRAVHEDLAPINGQVINLGTGEDRSIRTVAELVVDRLGKSRGLLTYGENRPGQVHRHIAGAERAARLLGWRARTAFPEGLERTIRWYDENRAWWAKLLWMKSVTITGPAGQKLTY